MRRFASIIVIVSLSLIATRDASADTIMYGASGQSTADSLFVLDPSTGLITSTIGNIGYSVTGLAVNPISGFLYGLTSNLGIPASNNRRLISVDTSTGAGTLIGTGPGVQLSDIAFSSAGILYGVGRSGFGTIDLTTGAFSLISNASHFTGGGLTFGSDGTLYYSRFLNTLLMIDPATGALLATQSTGSGSTDSTAALAFDPGTGRVYGVDRPIGLSTLYSLSAPAGAIGSPGVGLDAIAFASVPDVADTLLLSLIGLVAVVGARRWALVEKNTGRVDWQRPLSAHPVGDAKSSIEPLDPLLSER